MKRLWLFSILVGLLLVACGGGNAAPSMGGDSPTAPAAQAVSRNYSIQISGDAEASIPPSLALAERYSNRYELSFGRLSHFIFFNLPVDITTGTFELAVPDDLAPFENLTVVVSIALDPDDLTKGAEDYDAEVNGTLTLDSLGDTTSGSFEFTATYVDDDNQEIRKTITVTGTFTDLTVRQNE